MEDTQNFDIMLASVIEDEAFESGVTFFPTWRSIAEKSCEVVQVLALDG